MTDSISKSFFSTESFIHETSSDRGESSPLTEPSCYTQSYTFVYTPAV